MNKRKNNKNKIILKKYVNILDPDKPSIIDPITGKKRNNWKQVPFSLNIASEGGKQYLYINTPYLKAPNISSHTLVNLAGKNKWRSVGASLLSVFGLVEKSDVELYQQHKGGIAEVAAFRYLQKEFPATRFKSYELDDFEGRNQFPEAHPFSGVLDIGVENPSSLPFNLNFIPPSVMPIEVKSKDWKARKKLLDAINKGEFPIDNKIQGDNQALLVESKAYMLMYVFLKPYVTDILRPYFNSLDSKDKINYELLFDELELELEDFDYQYKIIEPDYEQLMKYRRTAKNRYDEMYSHKRIPLDYFNQDEVIYLKMHVMKNMKETNKS